MSLPHYQSDQTLTQLSETHKTKNMRELFEKDPLRFNRFSVEAAHVFLDYSKNRIDEDVVEALLALAREADLPGAIEAMFEGQAINNTEHRPALHVALRGSTEPGLEVDGINLQEQISQTHASLFEFVDSIHAGEIKGYTGQPIDTLVSIGIGGSFLGPLLVNTALKPYQIKGFNTHYVANIDPSDLHQTLNQIDPETTLFLVQSKSFGTQETLENALSARAWFREQGAKESDINRHFAAVSANVQKAVEFGISSERIFPMWDWVGGRYSLWSAIGLPIVFQYGKEVFLSLVEGAKQMDLHFRSADLNQNIPVILGMLGVWYHNYFDASSHAILPYDQYLEHLPAYLQQLDMESNGKSVNKGGRFVAYSTGPVIWGGIGCNGQHAYHQLLHQGTQMIPVDFIATIESQNPVGEQHHHLVANCLAQSQAMMQGKTIDEARHELKSQGLSDDEASVLAPHKVIAGNKPSNVLMIEKLTPQSLGALIAMYEHKVFVQGIIWGINSFDQWGVELGKTLEKGVYSALQEVMKDEGEAMLSEVDSSTKGLLIRYSRHYRN